MKYVLEKISTEGQAKILGDAESFPEIKGRILMRGGHFNNNSELTWAIDRGSDSYMFYAPNLNNRSHYYYLIYIRGQFYGFHVKAPAGKIVYFDTKGIAVDEFVRNAIKDAFFVYGHFGRNVDSFLPVVAEFE